MEKPSGEPQEILLKDLKKEYYRLQFLVDTGNQNIQKEMEVSFQAGRLVGSLYDALLKQYIHPENEESLKSLNILCVRLVFCLYAEDAGIFGVWNMFCDYLKGYVVRDARRASVNKELLTILLGAGAMLDATDNELSCEKITNKVIAQRQRVFVNSNEKIIYENPLENSL